MDCCLATVADKNFLIGFEVMLYSFIKNNSWFKEEVIIVSNDLGEKDLKKIKSFYPKIILKKYDEKKYGEINAVLDFDTKFDDKHGSYTKFEIFSLDYERVVFLDSDMLVLENIKELFEEEFKGNIAMVPELKLNQFNTGLMVIKKDFLEENITKNLIEETKKIGLTSHVDQDIINNYFKGKITPIPLQYNFLKDYMRHKGTWTVNAKIIHFISKKPWDNNFKYNKDNLGNAECIIVEDYWKEYKKQLDDYFNHEETGKK
jgi:lipopolysaccharide biosynthesis glycosyltransferase